MKKLLTIIGARPQFVKAAVVSKALQKVGIKETILHTGQHFDRNMSNIFFEQLDIPFPDYLLNIHGGNHGHMTGRMLIEIEKVLLTEKPEQVLVYGDTNSTLAGALAASKLHIPVVHIEAGLRSFNMLMPEEINRILTDQLSSTLFCPTDTAVQNLRNEGFASRIVDIIKTGDVMQDSALFFSSRSVKPKEVDIETGFVLATLHRAENIDDPNRLISIISALNVIHSEIAPVILPLHPRTRHMLHNLGLDVNVKMINPVGYLEILWLLKNSSLVLTDSGGMQKESFFFGKYCVTMRDQTEWVELVENQVNTLVGADFEKILSAVHRHFGNIVKDNDLLYGGGQASKKIADYLKA